MDGAVYCICEPHSRSWINRDCRRAKLRPRLQITWAVSAQGTRPARWAMGCSSPILVGGAFYSPSRVVPFCRRVPLIDLLLAFLAVRPAIVCFPFFSGPRSNIHSVHKFSLFFHSHHLLIRVPLSYISTSLPRHILPIHHVRRVAVGGQNPQQSRCFHGLIPIRDYV